MLPLQLLVVEDLAAKSKAKIIIVKSFLYICISSSISSIAEHQAHSAIEFVIDTSVTVVFSV